MAVSVTNALELRVLQADMQKRYKAYGYFAQTVSLAGDASGGAATLTLQEQDDKSKHSRLFWPRSVNVRAAGNTAVVLAQLYVIGKTNPQTNAFRFWGEISIPIGSAADGIARWDSSDPNHVLLEHGWFAPIRAKQTTGSEVELFTVALEAANPTASTTLKLDVFGLWTYIEPWR